MPEDKSKILLLIRFLKKALKEKFKAEVEFPDVQKVHIENPQEQRDTIKVEDLDSIKPDFSVVVNTLKELNSAITQELKSVKDKIKPTEFKSLETKLDQIKEELSRPQDFSSIISALDKLEQTTNDVELSIDLSKIEKKLDSFNFDPIEKYTLHGEVMTRMNGKQFEKLVKAMGKSVSTAVSGGGGPKEVTVENKLVPEKYDYISLSYTGDNLTTVAYKTGGSGGTTVATLTLAYTGAILDSVTKV